VFGRTDIYLCIASVTEETNHFRIGLLCFRHYSIFNELIKLQWRSTMKIGIFGGTQGVGLEAVKQALADNHQVTVLARTPEKLQITDDNLTIVAGNVLNLQDVEKVVAGQDVIINSLGTTSNNPDDVCTVGTRHIIAKMKEFGVKRLLTVTALGVGESRSQLPMAFRLLVGTVLRKAYADKETQEEAIRASGLEWLIARPGGLTNEVKTGKWTAMRAGDKAPSSRISRADVAAFLLAQLDSDEYLYEAVGLVA
jgi:putative NADH-flavin reductase